MEIAYGEIADGLFGMSDNLSDLVQRGCACFAAEVGQGLGDTAHRR
jgi:hypothetical protein